MTPRTDMDDMTDAQDEAPERVYLKPGLIRQAGGYPATLTFPDHPKAIEYVRSDLARPSQAGDATVARLIRAVECERNHKSAYDATPQDRGGHKGPKGQAYQLWMDARADVGAALAAMDTPKGGGDE